MRTLKHYRAEITDPKNGGILGQKNEFVVNEHAIIGENDDFLVINDRYFTTLSRAHNKYGARPSIEHESISIHANDKCWGNRVTYDLYTFKSKRSATIRKEIENEIQRRFGFFATGFDLSVITDGQEGAAP